MKVFVARQPIYDTENNVVAYELLFRSGKGNFNDSLDGTEATIDVIYNSFYTIGIENVTNGKKAFINLTETLIKEEIITLLPPSVVSIEILEDIEPTKELVECCRLLKEKGYEIILDDFVFDEKYRELIELVDIVKIDFRQTTGHERRDVISKIGRGHIKFLAEKVENIEEVDEAKELGYSYFQGYFFGKPEIMSADDIPPSKYSVSNLMQQLDDMELNIKTIEKSIEKDVAIFFKLIKFMNSSVIGVNTGISSIEGAVMQLGRERFIKWLQVILIANIKRADEENITIQALMRAKFAYNICMLTGNTNEAFNAYIMGMTSAMDAILNCSVEDIIKGIDLYPDICDALKGGNTYLGKVLNIIKAYESNDWESINNQCLNICIDKVTVKQAYDNSLSWLELA